jgi:hypothetical protein
VIDIADTLGLGATSAGMPVRFRRDNHEVVLLVERNPVPAQLRRIVPTPPTAIGEIVVIDSLEALLLRPDRL